MNPLRHDNITQIVPVKDFRPLLRNETPYFGNLNRAPKDAYDYANNINKILSYGGYVSYLKPFIPSSNFSLYNIVRINDTETIESALKIDDEHSRFGIVVTEADSNGYYVICTFCPNFVYPSTISLSGSPSAPLYLNETITINNLGTTASGVAGTIGNVPIARITGMHSIFFSGTLRSITA